jgi:transposase
LLKYSEALFEECAHGDGDAQATRKARRYLGCTHGVGFCTRSSFLSTSERAANLEAEQFDQFVEERCAKFYISHYGRPSLIPGIHFRLLLIGYFEGIDSERGIAWRLADSLALRRFVGIALTEDTPDHSTLSRTRRRIDVETHQEVFGWILNLLADRGLLRGQRVGIDATTLEANAAMRSIVRRETARAMRSFCADWRRPRA